VENKEIKIKKTHVILLQRDRRSTTNFYSWNSATKIWNFGRPSRTTRTANPKIWPLKPSRFTRIFWLSINHPKSNKYTKSQPFLGGIPLFGLIVHLTIFVVGQSGRGDEIHHAGQHPVQQSWPARLRSGPEEDPAHDGTGFLPTFSQVGSLSRTCQWSQQLEKIPFLVIFSTLNISLILLCIISLKIIRCKLDSITLAKI
jgi:hypothetical protein